MMAMKEPLEEFVSIRPLNELLTKRTLNELRESAGLNQTELADILEISPKTLWLYEQDSSNIPDELIKKYMYLFDVPYENIFFGSKYEKFVQVKNKVIERAVNLKKII